MNGSGTITVKAKIPKNGSGFINALKKLLVSSNVKKADIQFNPDEIRRAGGY